MRDLFADWISDTWHDFKVLFVFWTVVKFVSVLIFNSLTLCSQSSTPVSLLYNEYQSTFSWLKGTTIPFSLKLTAKSHPWMWKKPFSPGSQRCHWRSAVQGRTPHFSIKCLVLYIRPICGPLGSRQYVRSCSLARFRSSSHSITCFRWTQRKQTHHVDILIMAALEPLSWCRVKCLKCLSR